jgi:plastocyanin
MRSLLALMLCAALGLSACGGSDKKSSSSSSSSGSSGGSSGGSSSGSSSASSGGASSLKLAADKSKLAFDKTSLSAKAGKVTIVMTNPSAIPHAIAVEGHGVDKDGKTVQQGGTSRVSVSLKAGTYEFYCPVDGHKQAGMEGKLVVK